MTTVRVRFTPNGTPTPGQISFVLRHDEGNRPIASGRDILNGPGEWVPVPVEGADVEVRPNDPGTHYVVKVRAGNDPQQTETFTIPPNGPINFGDLVRYDPKAGMAYEPDPNWYAHLSAVENGINGVQAELTSAVSTVQGIAATTADSIRGEVSAEADRAETSANTATTVKAELEQVFLGGTEAVNDAATGVFASTEGTATRGAILGAVDGTSGQGDLVEKFSRLSPYSYMRIKKMNSQNQLYVTCFSPSGRHVTYEMRQGPRYRYVGRVWVGGVEKEIASSIPFSALTTAGAWTGLTSSSPYATAAGATFTATVETKSRNAEVVFTSTVDDRGGMWRLNVVGLPSATVDISTWNATITGKSHAQRLTIPEPGEYTVRGEFLGADPENPPSDGNPRGWTTGGIFNGRTVLTVDEMTGASNDHMLSQISNRDIAIQLSHPDGGSSEFVPSHGGNDTEVEVTAPVYYDGLTPINVDAMAIGETRAVESFGLVQRIYGVNPFAPTDHLVDLRTIQRISPNGVFSADGAWKTLRTVNTTVSMYHAMLTGAQAYFDEVISTQGNGYPNTTNMYGTTTFLEGEADRSNGFATIGSSYPNFVAAVRINDPVDTIRRSKSNKPAPAVRTFIDHRNADITKVYPRLYAHGITLPSGTRHVFSADFFYGEIPGAYHVSTRL